MSGYPFDNFIQAAGEHGIADYLHNKGFRIYKPVNVSDSELINCLPANVYIVATEKCQIHPLQAKPWKLTEGVSPSKAGAGINARSEKPIGMAKSAKAPKIANYEAGSLGRI